MISFSAKIKRFAKKGEKTGWSYIEISESLAAKLNPGCKKSFRIKGKLDEFIVEKTALLPMGDGNFILAFNAVMRKGTGKEAGDSVKVQFEVDERAITLSADFIACLKDDARAYSHFKSLPKGHQNYFSKWIDSAKTIQTKTKRITMALVALSEQQGFSEMIRANKTRTIH
jgi:hypothetical protein